MWILASCLNFGIYKHVGEEEGIFERLLTMRCVYVFVLALDEDTELDLMCCLTTICVLLL